MMNNYLFKTCREFFLCFVDRASPYNRVKKRQLDAQLILSIFRQPLHVSGVSRPSSGGTTICIQKMVLIILYKWLLLSNQDNRHSSKKDNKYQLLYTYGCTSWWWPDTPEICRCWRNILRISCASSWHFFTRLCRG